MSTKTSNDMHVGRSTTRRHAPPGGVSTFSVAWEENPKDTKVSAVVNEIEEVEEVYEPEPTVEITSFKVGLAIVQGPGSDILLNVASKALGKVGIVNVVSGEVPYASVLPYAAQQLIKSTDAVLALEIVSHDPIGTGNGSNSAVLSTALYQVGVAAEKPVVPGIVCQESLLEAKGVLPNLCDEWANGILSILNISSDKKFGKTPAPAVPPPSPPTPDIADSQVLLSKFRETLKARGASGIFGLSRKFKIMDDDNSKSVSFKEFSKAIKEHTLTWTPEQIKIVFDHFDSDKSGEISFDEFLIGVRGELNERREQLVLMAFEILDSDKSGVIELNDIKAKYDPSKHPDVIAGKRSGDEILREFLDTFDGTEKDGKVTVKEFCKYYANLSSSIDEDDYFELMIRNAWHISGGEGWCENTTCRRVLVTHKDGTQTVEEIKNDLGIKADDKEAMIARLVEQGIKDIASIDLKGSVDTPTEPPVAPAAAPAPARVGRRVQGGAATIVLG